MKHRNRSLNRFIKNLMITVLLILAVLLGIREIPQAGKKADWSKAGEILGEGISYGVSYIWQHQYPASSWNNIDDERQQKSEGSSFVTRICDFLFNQSPLYRYDRNGKRSYTDYQEADPSYFDYVESGKFYEEHSFLLYDGGEESGEDGSINAKTAPEQQETDANKPAGTNEVQNALKDPAMTCAVSTVWPIVGTTYRKEQLADYDYLMKYFYSVHSSTTAGRDLMKADEFLAKDFTLEGGNDKPQILIYHTHSQEEFADYGVNNPEATVVGIGNYLTQILTEKGYQVIHDTSVYDLQNGKLDRNKAYTYALDGISGILQENPSIEVVLDIHRDGVNENLHMVNTVNGKATAPIMFFNGVSQTPDGAIEYLPNPYREENLAFSFQMQLDAAAYFPNLTRKIYIKGLRYNQHLRARSALIEVGAQTSTYQEALNAMEPLAEVLDMVLQGN